MEDDKFDTFLDKAMWELTDKQAARLLASVLELAFRWDDTDEGWEYWAEVTHKLWCRSKGESSI